MAQWPPRSQYPQQRQQYQPQYQQPQGETDWQLTGVKWARPEEARNLRPGFVKQRPNYNYVNYYDKPNYNKPNYNGRPNYNQPNYNRPNYGNYYGKKVDTSYLAPVSRNLISEQFLGNHATYFSTMKTPGTLTPGSYQRPIQGVRPSNAI